MQVISFGYVYKGKFTEALREYFGIKLKKLKFVLTNTFERIILSVCAISIKPERILDMVFEQLRSIICEQLELQPSQITMESSMADELGADSLDLVDIIMSIEDEFDVDIPDEEVEKLRCVGDLVHYIEDHQ